MVTECDLTNSYHRSWQPRWMAPTERKPSSTKKTTIITNSHQSHQNILVATSTNQNLTLMNSWHLLSTERKTLVGRHQENHHHPQQSPESPITENTNYCNQSSNKNYQKKNYKFYKFDKFLAANERDLSVGRHQENHHHLQQSPITKTYKSPEPQNYPVLKLLNECFDWHSVSFQERYGKRSYFLYLFSVHPSLTRMKVHRILMLMLISRSHHDQLVTNDKSSSAQSR